MTTLLLTGAGGPAGKALGRQLQGSGLRLVGVDMVELDPDVAALFDRTVVVPRADAPDFLPVVSRLARQEHVDLVISSVQEELPHMAAAAPLFDVPVVISGAGAVGLAQDKLLTMSALRRAGVPTPWTAAWSDAAGGDLPPAPLVVKPRFSRGGRGVVVVDDLVDLSAAGDLSCIVQGFAGGDEYAVQVYRSPHEGASASEVVVLEKTALKEGRTGNAVGVRRLANEAAPDVADVAERAIVALGVVGPADVDVRRDEHGHPLVLEVNARFGANSEHAPELLRRVLDDYLPRARTEAVA
ncbi:MAG: ATP-grasp domain-containing protein [Dermatophilus congolensis]|nr:ATP-grasp domain-containing protein [Dermatophilus congolensis]